MLLIQQYFFDIIRFISYNLHFLALKSNLSVTQEVIVFFVIRNILILSRLHLAVLQTTPKILILMLLLPK